MQQLTRDTLQEIGAGLDRNQYPHVKNGGIVTPGDTAVYSTIPGEDKHYGNKRSSGRPETGSWQRPAGWQRTAFRPGTARQTPPLISSALRSQYEAELNAVREAYPGIRVWQQEEGMWLLTESSVLHGLGKKATFLSAIPCIPTWPVRSWGFWSTPISVDWIGPRHTNFPDGSICAFEPGDGTWVPGESLISLFDLYSVWALRHLYLKEFGRWPGYQSVHHPYERLTELRDDEYCGCGNSDRLYGECCKQHDLASNCIADAVNFLTWGSSDHPRKPPQEIVNFVWYRQSPPLITDIYT